jgi:hypothetical protein
VQLAVKASCQSKLHKLYQLLVPILPQPHAQLVVVGLALVQGRVGKCTHGCMLLPKVLCLVGAHAVRLLPVGLANGQQPTCIAVRGAAGAWVAGALLTAAVLLRLSICYSTPMALHVGGQRFEQQQKQKRGESLRSGKVLRVGLVLQQTGSSSQDHVRRRGHGDAEAGLECRIVIEQVQSVCL